jgi:murein L,D-transpeptidase YafK
VGRIGRGILNRAKVQLENINSNVLGVILNNVKPDVAPDFYRYRTDYYYRAEGDEETEPTPTRWWDFLDRGFQGVFGKLRLSATAEGKRSNIFPLILLVGILAIAGLAWHNYPKIRSAFQSRLDQKKFSEESIVPKKPISPAVTAPTKQPSLAYPSAAQNSESVAAVAETPKEDKIQGQEGIRPGQPIASQPPGKEEIEPSNQTAEEQPPVQTEVVAPTPVTKDKVIAEKEPAKTKVASAEASAEASIENFVEKWRRSWKEGDLQTYIRCYHSSFTSRSMDIQAWKNYKQDIFNRTVEREVQLSDIKVERDGSIATVTFKQSYETENYKGHGLKTLQLANYQGNWSILEESYESLPPAVRPVDAAIQRFVENWRRAWEEGDLQAYMDCYDPGFRTEKMDTQAWKSHKQRLFSRSAKRNVQISDIQIQENGSSALITFEQRYRTAKHQDVGLKTLQLRRHKDRWTILKENWHPIPAQG